MYQVCSRMWNLFFFFKSAICEYVAVILLNDDYAVQKGGKLQRKKIERRLGIVYETNKKYANNRNAYNFSCIALFWWLTGAVRQLWVFLKGEIH